MGWADDLGAFAKKAGKGSLEGLDAVTDVLVDKEAWSRAVPGGKPLRKQDIANMVLDSTMVIPGAGLAGGLARAGVRTATKELTKAAAREAAQRTASKTMLRSGVNNAIRGSVDDLLGRKGASALIRKGWKEGGERGIATAADDVARAARKASKAKVATRNPLDSQIGRMAAKQRAGIGRRVGFGQTKRRIAANTGLTVGANAALGGYDMLMDRTEGPAPQNVEPGSLLSPAGGPFDPSMYMIVGGGAAGGQQQMTPERWEALMADFMEQNGIIRRDQLTYNE